jgi:hypothetical protein
MPAATKRVATKMEPKTRLLDDTADPLGMELLADT